MCKVCLVIKRILIHTVVKFLTWELQESYISNSLNLYKEFLSLFWKAWRKSVKGDSCNCKEYLFIQLFHSWHKNCRRVLYKIHLICEKSFLTYFGMLDLHLWKVTLVTVKNTSSFSFSFLISLNGALVFLGKWCILNSGPYWVTKNRFVSFAQSKMWSRFIISFVGLY